MDFGSSLQLFATKLSKEMSQRYLDTKYTRPEGKYAHQSKPKIHIEGLPKNIIDHICSCTPYENLLLLSQTSKKLHHIVDPSLSPYELKISFVLRAERDFVQHYDRMVPNIGCYSCCKVLPVSIFDMNQPLYAAVKPQAFDEERIVALRRFCFYCGVKMGCHKPGDVFTIRALGSCWLCRCIKICGGEMLECEMCKAERPQELNTEKRKKRHSFIEDYERPSKRMKGNYLLRTYT